MTELEHTQDITGELSSLISASSGMNLPGEVLAKAKYHVLDTLASIVSGSVLKPGKSARDFIEKQGGVEEAQVIGTPVITSAINAALANGMMAHADETDDFDPRFRIHPGASVVPAALAMAEREGVGGAGFLRAVVIGYEIGCRIIKALGADNLARAGRSSHAIGNIFGAAAAAASVAQLHSHSVRYVLSYAAQQSSGMLYWPRDEEHIEKSFLFGGMPARDGVSAAVFVQSGFTGVSDAFTGANNFFMCMSPESKPELLIKDFGIQYEIMNVYIKKFPVGRPIQAALDALVFLLEQYHFKAADVQRVDVRIPSARVVDNREMPDINLQYLLASVLLEGKLTIAAAHSYDNMNKPEIVELKKLINLIDSPELSVPGAMRQAKVEIIVKHGSKFEQHVTQVRGSPYNPMTVTEVEEKSYELLAPVLGGTRSRALIDRVWNIETIRNMRELRSLLSAS